MIVLKDRDFTPPTKDVAATTDLPKFVKGAELDYLSDETFIAVCGFTWRLIRDLSGPGYVGHTTVKSTSTSQDELNGILNLLGGERSKLMALFDISSSNASRWLNGETQPEVRNLVSFMLKHCGLDQVMKACLGSKLF